MRRDNFSLLLYEPTNVTFSENWSLMLQVYRLGKGRRRRRNKKQQDQKRKRGWRGGEEDESKRKLRGIVRVGRRG